MLPSSTAGGSGGIIDATKASTFVAQLNASTWIDAYKLVIRQNTADNTIVYNTGIQRLDAPFYPTDASGQYVPFTVTVPASSAPLGFVGVTVSPDFMTVWVECNMAIKAGNGVLADSIQLSTDGGSTWDGTSINAVSSATIKGSSIKITFANMLTGRTNVIRVLNGAIMPVNSYFQTGSADYTSSVFTAFLEDSLVSMNVTSATVCAGGSFSATITGNKDNYTISRNAVISITASGSATELASRTQADNRISYTLMGDAVYFHVGASISAGEYVFSYTDNALTGEPKTATAIVKVIAANSLTYTNLELDETNSVVVLTMNMEVSSAKSTLDDLASAILLSVDGGVTWTGTTDNPIVAVGFTNTEKTYSQAAVNNMRIAFASPLSGDQNIIKIPADCIKSGSTNNVEIITHVIKIDAAVDVVDDDAAFNDDAPVSNVMVNGYANGYKWTLTIWSGYDVSDPESNMIESFEACFDAKDDPIVTLDFLPHVTSRNAQWTGSYEQGQNVPMMWIRWMLVTSSGETVFDTGSMYSNGALTYSYDSLVSGKSYTIILTCMTQDGVEVFVTGDFDVQYTTLDSNGLVRVYQRDDGSIEFQCTQPDYITGVVSGDDLSYLNDVPVEGHTCVSTGADTTVSFSSTQDYDMNLTDDDTMIVRIHSLYDGELLHYISDDKTFEFSLIHRGLSNGLVPNTDLYPSSSLYPDETNWGEFVYIVNGDVIAVVPTPQYSFMWYTLLIKTNSFEMYGTKLY